jgi:DNA-binding transcriptional MerR regulator
LLEGFQLSSPDRSTADEVAAMLGVSAETIDVWCREFDIAQRDHQGHGAFDARNSAFLRQIKRAVGASGLSLRLVADAERAATEREP